MALLLTFLQSSVTKQKKIFKWEIKLVQEHMVYYPIQDRYTSKAHKFFFAKQGIFRGCPTTFGDSLLGEACTAAAILLLTTTRDNCIWRLICHFCLNCFWCYHVLALWTEVDVFELIQAKVKDLKVTWLCWWRCWWLTTVMMMTGWQKKAWALSKSCSACYSGGGLISTKAPSVRHPSRTAFFHQSAKCFSNANF